MKLLPLTPCESCKSCKACEAARAAQHEQFLDANNEAFHHGVLVALSTIGSYCGKPVTEYTVLNIFRQIVHETKKRRLYKFAERLMPGYLAMLDKWCAPPEEDWDN